MSNIFSQNLKKLRELRGFSLSKLGELIGVSKQSVHKHEKGDSIPQEKIIVKLAETLGVTVEKLFRSGDNKNQNLERLSFRDEFGMAAYVLSKVEENAVDYVKRYLKMEELVESPTKLDNPLKGQFISSEQEVEEAAQELRDFWGLGKAPIANSMEFLERKGVKVFETYSANGFDGFSGWFSGTPMMTINTANDEITRRRFTCWHEAGHLLLTFPEGISHEREEMLCDHFAGAMLLPKDVLKKEMSGDYIYMNRLIDLKEYFGISMKAIMYRAIKLKLIHWDTYNELKKVYSNMDFLGDYIGAEKPKRYNQLIMQAVTEDKISHSKASDYLGKNVSSMDSLINRRINLLNR